MVFRHGNGEIAWACDVCGDEGVITGWEGSPTDVSELDDSYADGEPVAVVMPRALFDLFRGVLVLDAASELLIARARSFSEGVVLAGSSDAFDELVGYVASEANAESDRPVPGFSMRHARCSRPRWWTGRGRVHGSGDEEVLGSGRSTGAGSAGVVDGAG